MIRKSLWSERGQRSAWLASRSDAWSFVVVQRTDGPWSFQIHVQCRGLQVSVGWMVRSR
jgi:hypothetical protein